MKIYQEVEHSSDNSHDTKLFFEAKNLSSNCEKHLSKLKSQIEQVLTEFRMTQVGRMAREVKKESIFIKDDAGLKIYKLPLSEVHKVTKCFI